jgi:hypothetical protein
MSPLDDGTVFFGALAAWLWPVMALTSTHDGNMRIDATMTQRDRQFSNADFRAR